MKFLIPSYKRSEKQLTLEYLVNLGYEKENIYISTQSEEDYELYSSKWGHLSTVIYREGSCVGDNRNNLLECLKDFEKAVMLDDDIKSIDVLGDKCVVPILNKEELDKIIKNNFDYTLQNSGYIWGIYPINNHFFMSKSINKDKLLIGTVLGIIKTPQRFKSEFKTKEDYEYCCSLISRGYNVIRFDKYSANALHKSKGGCEENWKSEDNMLATEKLVTMYPRLVKYNEKKRGEVLLCKKKIR